MMLLCQYFCLFVHDDCLRRSIKSLDNLTECCKFLSLKKGERKSKVSFESSCWARRLTIKTKDILGEKLGQIFNKSGSLKLA